MQSPLQATGSRLIPSSSIAPCRTTLRSCCYPKPFKMKQVSVSFLATLLFIWILFPTVFSLSPSKSVSNSARAKTTRLPPTSSTTVTSTTSSTLNCSYNEALHLPTNKCYQVGKQGPCSIYEEWHATSENATEGECSCRIAVERCGNEVNQPIARSVKDRRCYPVYSKANCKDPNEWFTFKPNSFIEGHCTSNPCADISSPAGAIQMNETSVLGILGHYDNNNMKPLAFNPDLLPLKPYWFIHEGKCVKTFNLGTCGPKGGNHTLIFTGTKPIPDCIDTDDQLVYYCFVPYHFGVPTRENKCPDGYTKVGNDCAFGVAVKQNTDYDS